VFHDVHAETTFIDVIGRFLNMGVEPYNFVSSLKLRTGQRLVRLLCNLCKRPYRPSDEELIESAKPEEHHGEVFF